MNRLRAGLVLVGLLVGLAAVAPLVTPYSPTHIPDADNLRNVAPSLAHPLGTDGYGRDLLSRVLYGARISLTIALLAVTVSMTLGTLVGVTAGYAGGVVDATLMRIVDAGLAVPKIFVVLVVLALWEHVTILALIGMLGFTGWFGVSRIVRAEVQSAREREFVAAARVAGVAPGRVLRRHILPNIAGPIIVTATLGVGQVILIEAGLSFLGLGVAQPTPSWGNMIAEGQPVLLTAPWIAASAGGAIVLTVLAFSLLGDGLRERLDPRAP